MSGIAGEIAHGRPADLAAVHTMCQKLSPRGPDGSGAWADGNVSLGHRRLATIDTSPAGAQPMRRPDLGLTITFDGYVSNFRELREQLAAHGHRFVSESDAEVVLVGWAHWGEEVVNRLEGTFAFAIAEREGASLVLVRDRLGVKPLYTAQVDGALRFASSLPALVAAGGVDTRIDATALHHYLTFHSVVPAPLTMLRGVAKVPPSTIVRLDADGNRTDRTYWAPTFDRHAERGGWSTQEWQEAVVASLRAAVAKAGVADVPVGVLLSGGVDSSLLVGLLSEAGHRDIPTFSIGFEAFGGESGDEFTYSDIIAERHHTDHHQIRIGTARMLPALDEAIGAMSEPMVSHDCIAFYLLAQEVSAHVKVVQSGQGADELFGGYHWYPPLAEIGESDVEGAFARYKTAFFDRDHAGVSALLTPQWLAETDVSTDYVMDAFARPGAGTAVDRALRLDTTVMLVDDPGKRVDNMTMAWGLEGRMPFLDPEVVDLAGSCPPELKLAHGGKGVLKEAARAVIPDEVIDRPKGYFPVPALKHLQGPYLDLVRDALYSRAARERGLYRPEAVESLLADPNGSLTPLNGNPLYQIALLEMWLQRHNITGVAA